MATKFFKDFRSLVYKDIVRRKKGTPFIIFISFILSFIFARLTVMLFPTMSLIIMKYHIHHFYYGIGLLIISNWIALVSNRINLFRFASVLFGVGMGLVADEIGLLLTCSSSGFECNYWARQSFDIVVVVSLVFLSIIYFFPFWLRFGARIRNFFGVKKK